LVFFLLGWLKPSEVWWIQYATKEMLDWAPDMWNPEPTGEELTFLTGRNTRCSRS